MVVCLAQFAPLFADIGLTEAGQIAAWIVGWQVVKVIPTVMRMSDLGRALDDAIFGTLVPVANIYLFIAVCLNRSPSAKRRARLSARWKGQPTWYTLAWPAARLMGRTAGSGLFAVLLLAMPGVLLIDTVEGWVPILYTMEPDQLSLALSASSTVFGFLGLYTLLQLFKRKTASPASWLPVVFMAPSGLVAGLFLAVSSESYGTLTPLHMALATAPITFLWQSIAGAAAVIVWVASADAAHRSETAVDSVWSRVKERWLQLLPAHAGRVQLVWIGGQVMVVPGLFYWVYSAFVDMVGTLEDPPPHPLTTRSVNLAWGMMSRLVKLCLFYGTVLFGIGIGIAAWFDGIPAVMAMLTGDASQLSLSSQLLSETIGTIWMWWVTVALYLMYRARVDQLAARQEAKAANSATTQTA